MATEMSAVLSSTSAQTLTLGIDRDGQILQHDRSAGDILADKPGSLLGTDIGELIAGPGDPDETLRALIDATKADRESTTVLTHPHGQQVRCRRRRDRRADQVQRP